MHGRRLHHTRTAALLLAFATSSLARGLFWDFLGCTQVDAAHDHGRILIARRDRLFRTIQLRVSEEAIFLDRVVVHFGNGASQELIVSERISPGGQDCVVDLPGERRTLESVEIWYYKEAWGHNPRVNLYGIRLPEIDGEAIAPEH
jgi:hypothetical protein